MTSSSSPQEDRPGPISLRTHIPLRSKLAVSAGKAAASVSRSLGRGSGGMIGGEVALFLSPAVLADVSRSTRSVIVSGTNGKSTTNRMVRAALSTSGEVASNIRGDNMPSGILTAFMSSPTAPFAALEVDEMHVPIVAADVRPAAFVLLNLSRDQLDRVGEIGAVEQRLRQAVQENPHATVVANCDDPLIASAAWDAPNVVWVSVGAAWNQDSVAFPRGGRVTWSDKGWEVRPDNILDEGGAKTPESTSDEPTYRRPEAQWWLEDIDLTPPVSSSSETDAIGAETVGASASTKVASRATLCGPDGLRIPLALALPGRVNLGNAAQAVAAAVSLGIPVERAVQAVGEVSEVAGRYSIHDINGRKTRMMLAKNPAGWQEAMTMVDPNATQVVVAVNGQIPDGEDLSWLWDVDFSILHAPGRTVIACGERGADLAVRLEYAGVHCTLVDLPMDAVRACEAGQVEMLLNYTALRDFLRVLDNEKAGA